MSDKGTVSPPALKHVIYPRESKYLLPSEAHSARGPEEAWLGACRGRSSVAWGGLWPPWFTQPFIHRHLIIITRHFLSCTGTTVKSRFLAQD